MLKLLTVVALVAVAQCGEFDGTWSVVYVSGPTFPPMVLSWPLCDDLQVTKAITTQSCANYEIFNVRTVWPDRDVTRDIYTEINSFDEAEQFFNSACGKKRTEIVSPIRHVGQDYYIMYSLYTPGVPSNGIDFIIFHRGSAPSKSELQRFIRSNAPEVVEGIVFCYDPFKGAAGAIAATPDQIKANKEAAKPVLNQLKKKFSVLKE